MVQSDGLMPIARTRVQASQIAHRIGDIRCGIEAGFQRGESIRVMQQIDLHAANINRTHAPRLNSAHFLKRLGIRSSVAAIAGSVIGPGPGLHAAIRRAAPGFNLGNRAEQTCRQARITLSRRNGRGANPPGLRQGRRDGVRGGDGGAGALLARGIRGGGRTIRRCQSQARRANQQKRQ
jgi:hypothetical protein